MPKQPVSEKAGPPATEQLGLVPKARFHPVMEAAAKSGLLGEKKQADRRTDQSGTDRAGKKTYRY
jgi:hypothetical protein